MRYHTYLVLFLLVAFFGESSSADSLPRPLEEIAKEFKDLNNPNFQSLPRVRSRGEGVYALQYPDPLIFRPRLGLVQNPATQVRTIHRTQTELIYDRLYTTDKYSRRINLTPPGPAHKKVLVLAGDSFTFGDGLDDADALHNLLNLLDSPSYALNYGQSGGSLNVFLGRLLFSENSREELLFDEGDLIYIYLDFHVARAVGTWPHDWTFMSPYFKKNQKNEMEYAGSIYENMSWLRKLMVNNADLLPEALKRNRFIPRITNGDYEYFCDLVEATKLTWMKRVKKGRFIFMFHPFVKIDERIISCLDQKKIQHAKLTITGDATQFSIPIDRHPSAYFNRLFAADLVEFLKKNSDR